MGRNDGGGVQRAQLKDGTGTATGGESEVWVEDRAGVYSDLPLVYWLVRTWAGAEARAKTRTRKRAWT